MSALESPCCELQHNETQQQHLLLSFVQPAWCYKEFTSLHLPSLIDVVPQLQTRVCLSCKPATGVRHNGFSFFRISEEC